jgi:hypothetical protein
LEKVVFFQEVSVGVSDEVLERVILVDLIEPLLQIIENLAVDDVEDNRNQLRVKDGQLELAVGVQVNYRSLVFFTYL